jgi:hypothetical protein
MNKVFHPPTVRVSVTHNNRFKSFAGAHCDVLSARALAETFDGVASRPSRLRKVNLLDGPGLRAERSQL